MPFHVDSAERARRAEVFACAAADAPFGVDGGYLPGVRIVRVRCHHLYCADRAVAGTVAALHIVGDADAILLYPYGVAYLDSRFVRFGDRVDSTCRAHFRALGALGAAIPAFVGHFRLHQLHQVGRRAQHLVGAYRYAELASRAMQCEVTGAQRSRRNNGGGTGGYFLVFDYRQPAVYLFLLRL